MKIILDASPNAPGCFAVLKKRGRGSILVQTDYDFPGLAHTFGWDMRDVQKLDEDGEPILPRCDHSGTDGTTECRCGLTAGDFISAAAEWICDNDGAETDDPGYF